MAAISSSIITTTSPIATSSVGPKESKFTLNTADIPDTRVLDLFRNTGFQVPRSTYDLKNNEIEKIAVNEFLNLGFIISSVVVVASMIVTAIGIGALFFLSPLAPILCIGGALSCLVSGIVMLSFSEVASGESGGFMTFLACALYMANKKLCGKSDPSGLYLIAQKAYVDFFTKNGPAIKNKLEELITIEEQDLAYLDRRYPTTTEELKFHYQTLKQERTTEIQNRIAFTKNALEQLAKAEAAAKAV